MAQSDAHLPKDATYREEFRIPYVRIGILGQGIVANYQVEEHELDINKLSRWVEPDESLKQRRTIALNGTRRRLHTTAT